MIVLSVPAPVVFATVSGDSWTPACRMDAKDLLPFWRLRIRSETAAGG